MSADLTGLTLDAALTGLRAGEFSAKEIAQAHLMAAEAASDKLGCYLRLTPDQALDAAAESDARLAKGEARALEGAPLAIKDLFCTAGVETTASSRILEGFVPTYESTVTRKLFEAGASMVGKTSLDEFAMGSSTETCAYSKTVNPWRARGSNADLTPGGSSGGSAAAVAGDLCLGATGTDTGGSIRQPAAFTGTVGVKPTYGLCSRFGVVAFASSLDHPGPIAKTVKDCAILLGVMAGHDRNDSTSLDVSIPDYSAAMGRGVKGLRIGVPKEYVAEGMPQEISDLWRKGADWLKAQGAEIVDVSLPHTKYALPCYYIIAPAEASSNLARYDGMRYGLRVPGASLTETYEATRAQGFGPEVQRRVMIGTYVLSAGYYDAYYLRAQKVRRKIADDFTQAFGQCDVLLTPATPSGAFARGERSDDPVSMYLNDIFTVTANLAGVPAMALPAGLSAEGLPLGLQLIAPALGEETLFAAGAALETAAGFTHKPERWW